MGSCCLATGSFLLAQAVPSELEEHVFYSSGC